MKIDCMFDSPLLHSLRGVADIYVVLRFILLLTCCTLTIGAEGDFMMSTVQADSNSSESGPTLPPTAVVGNKTGTEKPVISNVSSDQVLNIYNSYGRVHLICEATGENITGGCWVKVDGSLSPNHNKSKQSYLHDGKTIVLKLTITRAHPVHSGRYHCVVYGQWGVKKSRNVNVIIKIAPPVITQQPNDESIVALRDGKLTCKARGYRVEYQWKRHNNNSIIGTQSSLTIIRATPLDEDQYYCVAMTEGGYAFSNNVTLKVDDYINLEIQPSHDIVGKVGESITTETIAKGPGKKNFTYQWKRTDNASLPSTASGENTTNLTITSAMLSDGGSYYCVVKNQWGNVIKSDAVTIIIILTLPVIITHPNSNGSIIVAEGNNVVLICEATGEGTLNYQWIKVSGSLPEGVLGNKDSHLIIRNIAVNDSGQYYCKVDNGGTSVSSMKAQVIVKRKPTIMSVSKNQTLSITNGSEQVVLMCKVNGDNITVAHWARLNGSLSNEANQSFNAKEVILNIKAHPHNSGDFQCIAQSQWGITHSRIVSVLIIPAPPVFILQPDDKVTVAALENVTFICEAKGFNVKYEWRYYNGSVHYTVSNYDSNSTLTLNRVTPSNAGHYYCVAKTGHGRDQHVFSHHVTLTVNDSFTVMQDQEYIAAINNSVTLNAVAKGPGSDQFKYQWEKVGSNSLPSTASGQDTPNLIITAVTMVDGGSYHCNVTNLWGNTVISNVGLVQVLNVEIQPLNNSVSALGSSVHYTCKSTIASSSVIYQWVHNGTVLKNKTSAVLNMTNVQWNETGIYYCMVTTTNNVSVESNRGYLIMSESAQHDSDEKSISGILGISIGIPLVVVIILIVLSFCCIYRLYCTRKPALYEVTTVSTINSPPIEMENQADITAATVATLTATTAIAEATTEAATKFPEVTAAAAAAAAAATTTTTTTTTTASSSSPSISSLTSTATTMKTAETTTPMAVVESPSSTATTTMTAAEEKTTTPTTTTMTTAAAEMTTTLPVAGSSSSIATTTTTTTATTMAVVETATPMLVASTQTKRASAATTQVSINGTSSIMDVVDNKNPELQKHINMRELLTHLIKYHILTTNEREHLGPESKSTNSEKVQYLLSKLDSKGEIGQEKFVKALYESSKEEGNVGHCKIIELFKNEGIELISEEDCTDL